MISLKANSIAIGTHPIHYDSDESQRILYSAGFRNFEDFWCIPRHFVEKINNRRGGWSGVSLLSIPCARGGQIRFYLKRQENQLRYSWRHLFGALTFVYEIEALRQVSRLKLPGVKLAAYGFRESGGIRQGVVVTYAIESPAFATYEHYPPGWSSFLPQLRIAGKQLRRMHALGWQHGALYPAHLFVNILDGSTHLIDFERARRRANPLEAAEADFIQFFRRSPWLPNSAMAALLESYRVSMPDLFTRLVRRFPERIDVLQK